VERLTGFDHDRSGTRGRGTGSGTQAPGTASAARGSGTASAARGDTEAETTQPAQQRPLSAVSFGRTPAHRPDRLQAGGSDARRRHDRAASLEGVREALGRLRGADSLPVLYRHATRVLCESVGFDHARLSRVENRTLVAESVYVRGDPREAERLLARALSQRPRLGPWMRESELFRHRRALLVGDASITYVTAPLLRGKRAIGMIHADRRLTGRRVTERDRDALWVFAEGLGYALERCVLADRMQAQWEHVRALVRSTEASVAQLAQAELELEPGDIANSSTPGLKMPEDELRTLLTPRELDVLAMLAEGQTNARIALRLVVSESTVKSHVKHILRKLEAGNRTEAVSRYLRAADAVEDRRAGAAPDALRPANSGAGLSR
jgi:DNA-binding CsgD family transcriptional regulator